MKISGKRKACPVDFEGFAGSCLRPDKRSNRFRRLKTCQAARGTPNLQVGPNWRWLIGGEIVVPPMQDTS